MCSFLFTNFSPPDVDFNSKLKLRGPDATNVLNANGHFFCHNLLSMRGNYISQPYEYGDVLIIFNGEIYNCPNDYESEGKFIYDSYVEHGKNCFRFLDGEYAVLICDYNHGKFVVARDCFGTKPLFVGWSGSKVGICTFGSVLKQVGLDDVQFLRPNEVLEATFDGSYLASDKIYNFNISQYKNSYDDWLIAFEKSVEKRSLHVKGKIFVGLSSGYDSGAIAAALANSRSDFFTLSVLGREPFEVISDRTSWLRERGVSTLAINDANVNRVACGVWLKKNVENFYYKIVNDEHQLLEQGKSVHSDNASLLLSAMCAEAHAKGARVYMSGSGADETISDYGFRGKKIFPHSNFGGKFPENLYSKFPWSSVFASTQEAYLAKEEFVAGSFGMEARYPFLDVNLFQEYLNLAAKLKNAQYKAPIDHYLRLVGFPSVFGAKVGFGFSSQSA